MVWHPHFIRWHSYRWHCISLRPLQWVVHGNWNWCEKFSRWIRYNTLPKIAELFKLETKTNRSLWRDRALVELNRAVSTALTVPVFELEINSLTRQFEKFCEAEAKVQCPITGDWSWLVPPISASQTPTFSQEFDPKVVQHTNFFIKQPHQKKLNQGNTMVLTARARMRLRVVPTT